MKRQPNIVSTAATPALALGLPSTPPAGRGAELDSLAAQHAMPHPFLLSFVIPAWNEDTFARQRYSRDRSAMGVWYGDRRPKEKSAGKTGFHS